MTYEAVRVSRVREWETCEESGAGHSSLAKKNRFFSLPSRESFDQQIPANLLASALTPRPTCQCNVVELFAARKKEAGDQFSPRRSISPF